MSTEIEIAFSDPFGNTVELDSIEGLLGFLDLEEKAWSWLESASHNPNDMFSVVSDAFAKFRTGIINYQNGQWTVQDLTNQIASFYGTAQPCLLVSDFSPGSSVQLIKEQHSVNDGEIAFALATNRSSWKPEGNLRAARIWNMLASPALIGPDAHIEEHRRKLGSLRGSLSRVVTKAKSDHGELLAQHASDLSRDRGRYQSIAIRMSRIGARRADQIGDRANTAIEKINATDNAFTLRMGLEAPVRYWRTKQRQHERGWKVWGVAVLAYLALVGIAVGFTFPSVWALVPVGESLSGRHILLVTSIGAALTLIFWVARLLIRIFLGERHLATDAEERRAKNGGR